MRRTVLLAVMVMVPRMALAATNCWVTEFPDHYEAVCVGDEKAGPGPGTTMAPGRAAAPTQAHETAKTAVPSQESPNAKAALTGHIDLAAAKQAAAKSAAANEEPVSVKAAASAQAQARTATGDHHVPTTIGLRRPPQSVRDAARASRMRLIMEERQKEYYNPDES